MKLPAELRNRIYDLAAVLDEPIDLRMLTYWAADGSSRTMLAEPSITAVCRLVREESLPVFYTRNTFTHKFDLGNSANDYASLCAYLHTLGKDRCKMLRHFEIAFQCSGKDLDDGSGYGQASSPVRSVYPDRVLWSSRTAGEASQVRMRLPTRCWIRR